MDWSPTMASPADVAIRGRAGFFTCCHLYGMANLLIALVTHGEPTLSNCYMHDVNTPRGHLGRVNGRQMVRPGIPIWLGLILLYFCC